MLLLALMRTLEYLRGVAPDECRRLRAIGIRHTNQLLHATNLEADRNTVARRTGIPPPRMLDLCQQCELLEISGMTQHLPVLRRLGVTTLGALRGAEAADLHRRLVAATGPAAAPTPGDVQYWISQARAIDIIEEDGGPDARWSSPSVLAGAPEATRTAL
ncbi:MAG: DUF4332 domain-containing protein [Candidatus Dormibacteraceae bacterium]